MELPYCNLYCNPKLFYSLYRIMDNLLSDIYFIRSCLSMAGSSMRTRQLFKSNIRVLEEERIQSKKDLRAHLKDQEKKRLRRIWPRGIATMTELRREVGLRRYLCDGIFRDGGQLTEEQELEMY